MNRIRSVRRRVPRTRASVFSTATGAVAAAGLLLAALAPGAMAADKPVAAPAASPADSAISAPPGYPAVPDRLLSPRTDAVLIPPPPANDDFANAKVITGFSGSSDGNNISATAEEGEPTIPNIDDAGVYHSTWYSWTAPGSGSVTFDICTDLGRELATYDSKMAAYTGSALSSLVNVAANDDGCGSSSKISFTAVSGTTYSITIDGYSGDTGYYTLQWGLVSTGNVINVGDVSATEGTSLENTTFDFTVTLSSPANDTVFVNWETVEGTATAPEDYINTSGTVVFLEGDSSQTVEVDVVSDSDHESDETFTVLLSAPEGAAIGDGSAIGTIENDDLASNMTVYLVKFGGKVRVGGYLSYYVQVYNAEDGDASTATVTDVLPENTTFAYADASQGTCTQTQTVVCEFGEVDSGDYATAVIYAYPNRTGVYQNTVKLETGLTDQNTDDNSDTVHTTVIAGKSGCTMIGTLDDDDITGTDDDDVICTYGGADVVHAGNGNDTVRAGSGDDVIYGGSGYDTLNGDAGADTFFGGANSDSMNGAGGRDTLSYSNDPAGVTVNLEGGYAYDGYGGSLAGAPTDVFDSMGDVVGSDFNDIIMGASDPNNLYGGDGDDSISGFEARDLLDGGAGDDSLNGGTSKDTCTTGETLTSCER